MIIEVFVDKILPGKEAEVQKRAKFWKQTFKEHGINVRTLKPETGVMSKIVGEIEFESHAERDSFWNDLPEDIVAFLSERRELFEVGAMEHYYYRVLE